MFDIGFWEIVAIAIIALIIIGPEQLPKCAHDLGVFFARIRHFIQSARRELERELRLDELDSLKNDLDDIDALMQQAPDRVILGEDEKKNNPAD